MSYAGAAYQISNASSANNVIVRKIAFDGTSTFSLVVPTGGEGSSLTNTDPLFGQGPVVRYKNNLFVVNANSNTISMFSINRNNPIDIKFITTAACVGDYPVSIAVNSNYVAVLNGGSNSSINFYTWTSSSLTTIPSWDRTIILDPEQTTPPNGPTNTVSDIIFSPDNNCVIVSYKGFSTTSPGGILIYPIQNNFLSQDPIKSVPQGSALSFSMTLVGKSALLVTDAFQGFSVFSYDSSTGETNAATTPMVIVPPSQGNAICWSVFSRQTKNYYLVGAASNTILEVSIDSELKPSIVRVYNLPTNNGLGEANILTINCQDYLYVNAPGDRSVIVMKLNGSGKATIIQTDSSLPGNIIGTGIAGMATISSRSNKTIDPSITTETIATETEATETTITSNYYETAGAWSCIIVVIIVILFILILFFY